MLSSTWELRVGIDGLTNLDLIRRGLYRVRISVTAGDGFAAVPVSCSAASSRLNSVSRGYAVPDSDLGADPGHIEEEQVLHSFTFVTF